ncbi:MAG: formimidoylglutamate deiminase [Gammaproteobacteria bacterium]|nr:formimidoylglutamate deiminase [Gammaproteobacteria bacterium]MCY4219611.1 formimidoylglutamate deiminase [Gammaproteobacteria bacterium]MCY4275486.1 formimidoylglutamate deiminase [Gammaproteobacteria bacterium]
MDVIWAKTALTSEGWKSDVQIGINQLGVIEVVEVGSSPCGYQVDIAIPAVCNLHSHGFQKILSGLTETRNLSSAESFWTWRKLLYACIGQITPDEIEAITAYAQIEMLECGFSAVAEFHYLHHDFDGNSYGQRAELSSRIIAAASETGIGLTLLPVFYQYSGCSKRPPLPDQARFVNCIDSYLEIVDESSQILRTLPADSKIGIAAHSIRAVDPYDLVQLRKVQPDLPFHMHISEQHTEVREFETIFGMRPVEWLIHHASIDQNWCLVHATHMTKSETKNLARTGGVVGLCPITEANLGDGIFNGVDYIHHAGNYGVGTDSNVRISLCEELRMLEYSQRLQHKQRAVLSQFGQSSGRAIFEAALLGGSLALARKCGSIEAGQLADIFTLDANSAVLADCENDEILDSFIFSGDNQLVLDVWSAGRHVVKGGQHIHRDRIQDRYIQVKKAIRKRLN